MNDGGRRAPGRCVEGLVPITHRHDHQRRPGGCLRLVIGPRDRARHVLRAWRQVRPDRVFAGDPLKRASGQERTEVQLLTVLLDDDDDERHMAVTGVGNRVDSIAEAGGRMHVDELRLAGSQRVSSCHTDHGTLM